jgi:adenylate cyclase
MARQALAERPGLTWPYRDLAVYYAAVGKVDQARDALGKFVTLRPTVTAKSLRDSLRFMEPGLLDRYVGNLEQAGLA